MLLFRSVATVLAVLSMAAWLVGQAPDAELRRLQDELMESKAEAERREGAEAERRVREAEGDEPAAIRALPGLEEYVRCTFGQRPQRLEPGGAGTISVILMMRRAAVIQAGAPIALEIAPRQGPLTFGEWSIQPPRLGELETRFQGRPVYDNTAIVEIPVRVGPGAAHGRHPMSFALEVQVSDGGGGAVLGLFQASLGTEVMVGKPLPEPRLRSDESGVSAQLRDAEPAADQAAGPVTGAPGDRVAGGRLEASDGEAGVGAPGAGSGVPGLAEGASEPSWLWVGAAILALVIGALLLSRPARG